MGWYPEMDLEDEDDEGDQQAFLGVLPAANRRRKRRRSAPPASHAFFYAPREQGVAPAGEQGVASTCVEASDPDIETAMMAALGLPTSLRPYTAESNRDIYQVWLADPTPRFGPALTISGRLPFHEKRTCASEAEPESAASIRMTQASEASPVACPLPSIPISSCCTCSSSIDSADEPSALCPSESSSQPATEGS